MLSSKRGAVALVLLLAVGIGFRGPLAVIASNIQEIAYNLVKTEGSPLPRRSTLNFTGAGVTVTDSSGETVIDIPGGGGGGAVQFAQVSMSNADFFGMLAGDYLTLVPSPGAGKFIQPVGPLVVSYVAGAVPLQTFASTVLTALFSPADGFFFDVRQLSDLDLGQVFFLLSVNEEVGAFIANNSLVFGTGLVTNGRIVTSHISTAGENWLAGDACFALVDPGTNFMIDTVGVGGAVLTYSVVDGGANHTAGQVFSCLPTADGNSGGLRSLAVSAGGLNYAPGDTGTVDGGGVLGTYSVVSVDGLGAVTALMITAPGSEYMPGMGVATTPDSGVGTGLTVDVSVLGSGFQIEVDTVEAVNSDFDGSFVLTVPYVVVTLP
jgi:hypothetical protein